MPTSAEKERKPTHQRRRPSSRPTPARSRAAARLRWRAGERAVRSGHGARGSSSPTRPPDALHVSVAKLKITERSQGKRERRRVQPQDPSSVHAYNYRSPRTALAAVPALRISAHVRIISCQRAGLRVGMSRYKATFTLTDDVYVASRRLSRRMMQLVNSPTRRLRQTSGR